jgi:UBA-like domain
VKKSLMAEVDKFVVITGADAETASFYLQSSNGDLEAAVNNYFSAGSAGGTASELTGHPGVPPAVPPTATQQPSSKGAGAHPCQPAHLLCSQSLVIADWIVLLAQLLLNFGFFHQNASVLRYLILF